ncbi:MAG TPA: M50 family peptidase [Aliiroseovarius sp.]|nr:M50 family peptidase [Aliiroseovarius sp.]
MSWLRGHWQLLLLTALVFVLWQTPVATPVKILIVFMHEVSHGLAALATGGRIEAITVSLQQGGLTTTRGGSLFAILSAGYLGSLVLGVAILLVALRTHLDRALMALLGAAMVAISAFYIRDWFAFGFGMGSGGLMLAAARFLPRDVNDLILRLIGLTSLIYVPYDIFDDTIRRASESSDAYMLADRFGGATMMWGGLWLVISALVIVASLRWGLGVASNISLGRESWPQRRG